MAARDELIHFVNVNIDKHKAYYHTKTGKLTRIAHGVYLRSGLNLEERRAVVLSHAPRIVHCLHQFATLVGASAYHHAAVGDAVCMATGMRYPRRVIDSTLLIYNQVFDPPPGVPMDLATIEDDIGAFKMKVMPDDVLILDSFAHKRGDVPAAARLTIEDLLRVVDRAMKRCGTQQALEKRLVALGEKLGRAKEAREALAFVQRQHGHVTRPKKNLAEYNVFWCAQPIATLVHDGVGWQFDYKPTFHLSLSSFPGKVNVPSFIGSLMPEKPLHAEQSAEESMREIQVAERYASNVVIRPKSAGVARVIIDTLEKPLEQCVELTDLVFTGRVDEQLLEAAADAQAYKRMVEHPRVTRMSGQQFKIPVFLGRDGKLEAANDRPFTHILKTSYNSTVLASLGVNEWFTMRLAAHAGIITEKFALVDMGPDLPPAFVAERFDIRRGVDDPAFYLLEDMWSALGYRMASEKMDAEMCAGTNTVAGRLLQASTQPEIDGRRLLKQVVFSWLMVNSDLHLKNLSLLKRARSDLKAFEIVTLSPAYDMMCTGVYPQIHPTAALRINGESEYTMTHLRALGKRLQVPAHEVDALVSGVMVDCNTHIERMLATLPVQVTRFPGCEADLHQTRVLLRSRSQALWNELKAGLSPKKLQPAERFTAS